MMAVGDPTPHKQRNHMSLAGQYLIMQLLIIGVVLTGVMVVSATQATTNFERAESRRSLSAAESLGANALLRALLPSAVEEAGSALPAMAESTRSVSGLDFVQIANGEGTILTSSYPDEVGSSILYPSSNVMEGRAWRGDITKNGRHVLVAHVPVLDDTGKMIGIVGAGQKYPRTNELLLEIAPSALSTLFISVLLGAVGSVLLARRVKHQTHGLEPREITELFEHREALLHGVKEGIISIGPDYRITLANDVAKDLLELPADCEGQTLKALNVEPQVIHALMTRQQEADRQFLVGEKVLVFNRMTLRAKAQDMGSVTTFRDRTELTMLEQELGDTRATTEMLRAQTHEFANQLHAISGLVQLEEYEEVVSFIDGVSFSRSKLFDEVAQNIEDPTMVALLIAKASVASERGINLEIGSGTHLLRCDEALARDLTTVVGNLIDNAIDAVATTKNPHIRISIKESSEQLNITVSDNGPGVDELVIEEIFTQGFSTKEEPRSGGRGFGLALSRIICRRRNGEITVTNDHGARFTARLSRKGNQQP